MAKKEKKQKAAKTNTKKQGKKNSKAKQATIPKKMSDSIPYYQVYSNDIFEVNPGEFSRTFLLEDVNFKTASEENQFSIAEKYGKLLGAFTGDVTIEITMLNRAVDIEEFKREIMVDMRSDGLNKYRDEYNNMLISKMTGAKNNLQTDKLLTVTVKALDIIDATEKLDRAAHTLSERLSEVTKRSAKQLSVMERLEMLDKIYNQESKRPLYEKRIIQGHEVESFTLESCARQGITTKEIIAPEGLAFYRDHFEMGNIYGKSFYVSSYPTWLKASILNDLAGLSTSSIVSVYFNAIPQEDAIKLIKRQRTNISSKMVEIQKKSADKFIDADLISPELKEARDEANELMDDMTKEDARLFTGNILISLFATSMEELKTYEDQLKTIANRNLLAVKALNNQQENAFNASLPIGNNKLSEIQRLMTTSTVSAIIPFSTREVRQNSGIYYGQNAISHNMILYDRTSDLNPNGCILGMPGSGKSFSAKQEIASILLRFPDDEIYILDPEREYAPMAKAFGGSVIKMETGSKTYINPFDMNVNNAADEGGDPVKVKTDFIETICEIAIGGRFGLMPIEQSIIDRCVTTLYDPYLAHLKRTGQTIDVEAAPTMADFYEELLRQPQSEAQNLALSLERYVKGALDIFSHKTNVEVKNKFTVYDIKDLGEGLKALGLQICLDNIWNKMIMNKEQGKRTWVYIDEFYLMMLKETSANYISQIWKRARKWNGVPTAITQNVEDMLNSNQARTIINNSPFIMLWSQSPINKKQLSDLLNISPEEQKYISSSRPGVGLLKIQDTIIPVDNKFPTNTDLYKLMTTKPSDLQ